MAKKIIIDTDPGVDDAMAIFLALNSPEVEVVGLTSVFGNHYVEITTRNALHILEVAGRTDIPVARGAHRPLVVSYEGPAAHVHGNDAMGDVGPIEPKTHVINKHAVQFIIDSVMSSPGEVTLVPVGPLTNIALAFLMEPRIAQNVREVVLMGGAAFIPGNISPNAEANIYNDADAAHVVFSAQWPITMIGLDVTHKVEMNDDYFASLQQHGKPLTDYILKIAGVYREFYRAAAHRDGIFVHDATAISYVIKPELFQRQTFPMRVSRDGLTKGQTIAAPRYINHPIWKDAPSVGVCVDVDGQGVLDLYSERILV